MRILLVEDNSTLAALFGVQLRQLGGHTLVTAASKDAAIAAFQKEAFDLVFVDMGLEGYQDRGIEILAEIKALTPQQRVGVLSSNDLKEMVRLSQKSGADFYMVKPFTLDGLAVVLKGDKEAIRNYTPDIDEGRIIAF
ncbi:MAG TPA: response regulator [Anaerolineae bacterium]|nr:response regulator [Anaerolineae bacterium]